MGFIAAAGSLALMVVAYFVQRATHLPLMWLLVIVTASWAAWDSTKIRVREYDSGIALHPVSLWIGIAMVWIVGFPWYLIVRHRIKAGTQKRKTPAASR